MDGAELRRLRRKAGLTQVALAALLPRTANTVARWERGEVKITSMVEFFVRLAIETKMPVRTRAETRKAQTAQFRSWGL